MYIQDYVHSVFQLKQEYFFNFDYRNGIFSIICML